MKSTLVLLFAALCSPAVIAAPDGQLLAVLALRNEIKGADRDAVDGAYFADVIRTGALAAIPGLRVMTRENMVVLLQATGKKLEDCEGECEVDTGRRLGADLIVSGELLKIGKLYKLDVRMHDTRDGRLRSGAQASGASVEELDQAIGGAMKTLFATLGSALSATPPTASAAPSPATPAPISREVALQRSCDKGDLESCNQLAWAYSDYAKTDGIAKNESAAFSIYARVCDLKAVSACNNAGVALWDGRGVDIDKPRANTFYKKGCEQGEGAPCSGLAFSYERGLGGLPANLSMALSLYSKSCSLNFAAGCRNASILTREGRGTPPDPVRARELLKKSCDLGFKQACDELR